MASTHERETQILKDFVEKCKSSLEAGKSALVRGGYISHNYEDGVIDQNCGLIVDKLSSLGYTYTTNHGHGCRDYRFTKKIEL